jgi:hypothetical protein
LQRNAMQKSIVETWRYVAADSVDQIHRFVDILSGRDDR